MVYRKEVEATHGRRSTAGKGRHALKIAECEEKTEQNPALESAGMWPRRPRNAEGNTTEKNTCSRQERKENKPTNRRENEMGGIDKWKKGGRRDMEREGGGGRPRNYFIYGRALWMLRTSRCLPFLPAHQTAHGQIIKFYIRRKNSRFGRASR